MNINIVTLSDLAISSRSPGYSRAWIFSSKIARYSNSDTSPGTFRFPRKHTSQFTSRSQGGRELKINLPSFIFFTTERDKFRQRPPRVDTTSLFSQRIYIYSYHLPSNWFTGHDDPVELIHRTRRPASSMHRRTNVTAILINEAWRVTRAFV